MPGYEYLRPYPMLNLRVKLILRFYYSIFLANVLITLSCIGLIGFFGKSAHLIVAVLFWYKLIATLLIFYLATYYKDKEFYYYQNLGVSRLTIGISTIVLEYTVFSVIFVLAYKLMQ